MEQSSIDALYDHLAATAERPVERTASRWLGEAEAIAGEVARSDLDPAVRRERVEQVAELLSHVETTGDEQADEHVDAARELLDGLLEGGD